MRGLARAVALLAGTSLGCAAGVSDDGPFAPPVVVDDGRADDGDAEGDGKGEDESGTGFVTAGATDGFDDAADTGDGAPPPEPTTGEPAPGDDGAEPSSTDDGAEPPPPPPDDDDGGMPPPPLDLDAECQSFCGALEVCGLVADATEAMQCMADCTISEGPTCDAAWSAVMSCVSSLDCFQMQVWSVGFPGYPCQAEEQAYGSC